VAAGIEVMKLIYVAGKFRGKNHWEVRTNVLRAEEAALQLAINGAFPVVPHKNTENFDGLLTDKFWLDGTMELMRRCDGVWIFNQHHLDTSTGTRAEMAEARRLDIPVFLGDAGLMQIRALVKAG
jgi:nucleoside 2-deoxyribosyltransferase